MIKPQKRKAIYCLHTEGMSIREICKQLQVSRKTVRKIINEQGEMSRPIRSDKLEVDKELLIRLYGKCEGYVQRIHEKLSEEHGINIGYSTLTRMIRELDLVPSKNQRCSQVPDKPGV